MQLRTNQVGYLIGGPKHVTVIPDSPSQLSAVAWELKDVNGNIVQIGMGSDIIDLTGFNAEGSYTLRAWPSEVVPDEVAAVEVPITVGFNLFDGLLFDALNLFALRRAAQTNSKIALDDAEAAALLTQLAAQEVARGNDTGPGSVAALALEEAGFLSKSSAPTAAELISNSAVATDDDAAVANLAVKADRLIENNPLAELRCNPELTDSDLVWQVAEAGKVFADADEAIDELRYRDAAVNTVDYLFGRNPQGICYFSESTKPTEISAKANAALAYLLAYISNEG